MAKITLYGFSKWMHDTGKDLFELLELPAGIDKTTLVNHILLQGGEFETLYADPNFLHDAIGTWSNKWQRTFEKWISALSLEYNPLDNYDRTETWTDTGMQTDQGSNSSTTNSSSNTSNELTNKVSAYDSSDFSNKDKSTSTGSDTGNVTSSGQNSNTMNSSLTHNARIHGNIGVTTSMQLLESELYIDQWNIIEHITDLFLNEFCIMVY